MCLGLERERERRGKSACRVLLVATQRKKQTRPRARLVKLATLVNQEGAVNLPPRVSFLLSLGPQPSCSANLDRLVCLMGHRDVPSARRGSTIASRGRRDARPWPREALRRLLGRSCPSPAQLVPTAAKGLVLARRVPRARLVQSQAASSASFAPSPRLATRQGLSRARAVQAAKPLQRSEQR